MIASIIDFIRVTVEGYGNFSSSLAEMIVGNDPLGKSLFKVALLGTLATLIVVFRKNTLNVFKQMFTTTVEYRCIGNDKDEMEGFNHALAHIFSLKKRQNKTELRRKFTRSVVGMIQESRLFTFSLGNTIFIHNYRPVLISYKETYESKIVVRSIVLVGLFQNKKSLSELIPPYKGTHERYKFKLDNTPTENGISSMMATSTLLETKNYFIPSTLKEKIDNSIRSYQEDRQLKDSKGLTNKLNFLFYGPPGTGKSTLGFYIAQQLGKGILTIEQIHYFLYAPKAAQKTNSIIFLDEVDGLVSEIGSNGSEKFTELTGNVKVLQMVLQGIHTLEDQVVVMTTNNVERLGSATTRVGRVDLLLEVPYYTKKDLREWLEWYFGDEGKNVSIDHLSDDYHFRPCDLSSYYDSNPTDLKAFMERLPEAQAEYQKWLTTTT